MNRAASSTPCEADAVLVAGRVEQVDEVLGGEIPRGAGRVGTAARAAGRAVEAADARRRARPATFARAVPRVSWKWNATRSSAIPAWTAAPVSTATCDGTPTPIVSPKHTSSTPELEEPERDLDGPMRIDGARVRAAERGRDVAAAPPAEIGRAPEHRREGRERLVDRHADVPLGERVGRRREHRERVGAGGLGAGHAALVRDEDGIADAAGQPPGARAAASSASASASCGIALGDTKLVASISRRPAAASRSMKPSLVSSGIAVASFWSPSRGPTS